MPRASLARPLSQTCFPAPLPHFCRNLSADSPPVPKTEPPRCHTHVRAHYTHNPSTCVHMRAQVCADTLRDGAAAERTHGEARQQGPFWNLLSKSLTGAVAIGSSPLGEPVQLRLLLPVALSISFETLQPLLGGSPSGTSSYSEGQATVLNPGRADFMCQSRVGRAAVGSAPRFGPSVPTWAGGTAPSHRPQKPA